MYILAFLHNGNMHFHSTSYQFNKVINIFLQNHTNIEIPTQYVMWQIITFNLHPYQVKMKTSNLITEYTEGILNSGANDWLFFDCLCLG